MRIISLSPSLTEIVISLKAADQLVGVSNVCEVGEANLQRVGSCKALEFSKIDSLSPECVLADSQDNRPEEIQRLQKKWNTKVFDVKSLDQVCDTVMELGRLVQKRPEAELLVKGIRGEASGNEEIFLGQAKKRTLILIWDTPYLTLNYDSYPSHLVEASGGVNVFHEEPVREFPVEMEDMIEKNPEVLLLPTDPAPFKSKHVSNFRRYRIFSKIPIHLIEGKLFSRYGVQTVEALKRLREIYKEMVQA